MRSPFLSTLAMAALMSTAFAAAAQAQDHRDDNHAAGFQAHPEWRQGGRIAKEDWGRGEPVDYRSHHLRAPPRGYEWRQVDGNYVLAAAATGLIASLIVAGH
jgi:Ni/Co efflux regulator RcnB